MGLNPFQSEVEKLALSKGLRGSAQASIYQSPDFMNLVQRFFGAIPLPAGVLESQVTNRNPFMVEFSDPQGYITRLERELSGVSPRLGEVRQTSTNRPAVLPIEKSNPLLGTLLGLTTGQGQQDQQGDFFGLPTSGVPAGSVPATQGQGSPLEQLINLFRTPVSLSQVDPRTKELLSARNTAENEALNQQFQDAQGTAIAQLVGQGIGSSSIAGDLFGQLLRDQGIVRSNTLANQADRELGVQNFLTQAQAGRDQNLQQFILDVLNQSLGRDVSGAQIGLEGRKLDEQSDQFFRQFQEQIRQFDEQFREQQRANLMNNIFRGISTAASFISPLASVFGGGGGIPAPAAPKTFPSSTVFGNFPTNPRLPGF